MHASDESGPRMSRDARLPYRITDQVFLWLLTAPDDPVLIGELNMVRSTRGVSLRYDVLPSGQALGYQQMRIGLEQADSTLVNAMSMSTSFGLTKDEAAREVRLVVGVIDRW
jgi:hypothetical protein